MCTDRLTDHPSVQCIGRLTDPRCAIPSDAAAEQSRFSVDAGSQQHSLPAPPASSVAQPWRPARPAPTERPPAPPASWRPRWPELVPPPALVPRPAPALVSSNQEVMRPTFPELQRGEPLLPADAPGAERPDPEPEQEPEQEPTPSGLLPDNERQRYQPSDADVYEQHPPPAQLRSRPEMGPAGVDHVSHQRTSMDGLGDWPAAAPPEGRAAGHPASPSHRAATAPALRQPTAQQTTVTLRQSSAQHTQQTDNSPQPTSEYHANQLSKHPANQSYEYPVHQPYEEYPANQSSEYPANQSSEYPANQSSGHGANQSSGQGAQRLSGGGSPLAQPLGELAAEGRGRAVPVDGVVAQATEHTAAPLLAQQATPAAAVGERQAAGGALLPPNTLAVLLQRLEERLVASETQQQRHTTQLRATQHRLVSIAN